MDQPEEPRRESVVAREGTDGRNLQRGRAIQPLLLAAEGRDHDRVLKLLAEGIDGLCKLQLDGDARAVVIGSRGFLGTRRALGRAAVKMGPKNHKLGWVGLRDLRGDDVGAILIAKLLEASGEAELGVPEVEKRETSVYNVSERDARGGRRTTAIANRRDVARGKAGATHCPASQEAASRYPCETELRVTQLAPVV